MNINPHQQQGASRPPRPYNPGRGSSARPAHSSHGSHGDRPARTGSGPFRPSSSSRPGGYRGSPGRSGNRGGGRGGFKRTYMNVSRFINKAVITEQVEKFVPEHRFEDFLIRPELKAAIGAKGFTTPTPIQDRAIPHVLRGSDVVGIANTGTGKTGAFIIPLINKILSDRSQKILIMVPTRELAVQINEELKGFTKQLSIYAAVCVGGASIHAQMGDIRRNPSFIIGTPGRIKDLIERRALNLSVFKTVVLDEADRMLDMGFVADIRRILGLLTKPHHTLFFSATLSPEIEAIIGAFLTQPVRISVKTGDTSKTIEQDIVRVPPGGDKFALLVDLLKKPGFTKVIVFGRTKHGVERLSKTLLTYGIKAESIHGNKTQGGRQKALDLFRKDHVQVLVATDVAARGLDISGISHVINYDLPATDEDYIHRIGRTGRAGKKGIALTFIE